MRFWVRLISLSLIFNFHASSFLLASPGKSAGYVRKPIASQSESFDMIARKLNPLVPVFTGSRFSQKEPVLPDKIEELLNAQKDQEAVVIYVPPQYQREKAIKGKVSRPISGQNGLSEAVRYSDQTQTFTMRIGSIVYPGIPRDFVKKISLPAAEVQKRLDKLKGQVVEINIPNFQSLPIIKLIDSFYHAKEDQFGFTIQKWNSPQKRTLYLKRLDLMLDVVSDELPITPLLVPPILQEQLKESQPVTLVYAAGLSEALRVRSGKLKKIESASESLLIFTWESGDMLSLPLDSIKYVSTSSETIQNQLKNQKNKSVKIQYIETSDNPKLNPGDLVDGKLSSAEGVLSGFNFREDLNKFEILFEGAKQPIYFSGLSLITDFKNSEGPVIAQKIPGPKQNVSSDGSNPVAVNVLKRQAQTGTSYFDLFSEPKQTDQKEKTWIFENKPFRLYVKQIQKESKTFYTLKTGQGGEKLLPLLFGSYPSHMHFIHQEGNFKKLILEKTFAGVSKDLWRVDSDGRSILTLHGESFTEEKKSFYQENFIKPNREYIPNLEDFFKDVIYPYNIVYTTIEFLGTAEDPLRYTAIYDSKAEKVSLFRTGERKPLSEELNQTAQDYSNRRDEFFEVRDYFPEFSDGARLPGVVDAGGRLAAKPVRFLKQYGVSMKPSGINWSQPVVFQIVTPQNLGQGVMSVIRKQFESLRKEGESNIYLQFARSQGAGFFVYGLSDVVEGLPEGYKTVLISKAEPWILKKAAHAKAAFASIPDFPENGRVSLQSIFGLYLLTARIDRLIEAPEIGDLWRGMRANPLVALDQKLYQVLREVPENFDIKLYQRDLRLTFRFSEYFLRQIQSAIVRLQSFEEAA